MEARPIIVIHSCFKVIRQVEIVGQYSHDLCIPATHDTLHIKHQAISMSVIYAKRITSEVES